MPSYPNAPYSLRLTFFDVFITKYIRRLDLQKATGLSFCKMSSTSKVYLSKGKICLAVNALISKLRSLSGCFLTRLSPTVLKRSLKMVKDYN